MPNRIAAVALLFAVAAVSVAAKPIDRTISWQDIPPPDYPDVLNITGSKSAREKKLKVALSDRDRAISPLKGREFFGLCQVMSVKPSVKGLFTVKVAECRDITTTNRAAPTVIGKLASIERYAMWLADRETARGLYAGMRFNITGKVADLSVEEQIRPPSRNKIFRDYERRSGRLVYQEFLLHLDSVEF